MSACVSFCLSVSSHNSKTVWPNFTNFLYILPVAVDRSFSDGVEIRYVLTVYGWRHVFILRADGRARRCVARRHQWTWPLQHTGSAGRFAGARVGRAGRSLSAMWLVL